MNTKIAKLLFACLIILSACKTTKVNYDNFFWGELAENQNYLFRADSLNAIVDGELNSGSRVLFGEMKGDFHEIYINKYKKTERVKYYLYKPKYKRLGSYSSSYTENILRANVEYSRFYQTGERGGCYYTNSNGNRIYVDKLFCNASPASVSSTKTYKTSTSKSTGGDIYVRGHTRTTKSGKTIYVKPHTRKRN